MIFKKYIFIVVLIIFVFDSYGFERTKLSGNTIFSKTLNSAKNNDFFYDFSDLKELSSTNEALFNSNSDWIISFGASLAKNAYTGEVAVINGLASDLGIMGGIKLGSEFSLNKKFYIAPKIGIEADLMFISARVSLINYTDFKYYEPKITPEIGLSVLGYFNVTYGYNISLTSKHMDYVPTNRISITFNIPLSTHPAP